MPSAIQYLFKSIEANQNKIDCRANYSRILSYQEYLIFSTNVPKSRTFIYILKSEFQSALWSYDYYLPFIPLHWLSSFCSSRATLYSLSVLESKSREYITGASALRLPTEASLWGGSTDRRGREWGQYIYSPVYLFSLKSYLGLSVAFLGSHYSSSSGQL